MHTKTKLALTFALLTLGAAGATDSATGTGTQTTANATASATVQSAVLLDAQGRVVGTFDKMGHLIASGMTGAATQVRVTLQDGESKTYNLAERVQANANTTLSVLMVKSGEGRATLGSSLHASLNGSANTAAHAAQDLRVNAQLLLGKTVTFTNSAGQTVGQFDADGQLRASGDLSLAKNVTITLANGEHRTYELAGEVRAGANGALKVDVVNVQDKAHSVALVSILAAIEHSGGAKGHASGDAGSGGTTTGGSASDTDAGKATKSEGSASGSASGETKGGVSVGVGVGVGIGIGGGK